MKQKLITLIYFLLSPFLIRTGAKEHVYITFDDGPHPENTIKVLNTLSENQCKATFFMVGQEMDRYPEVVEKIIQEGHGIGYHSYDHRSLKKLSLSETIHDFKLSRVLEKKLNFKFKFYRPPYGDLSISGFILSIFHGQKIIMWSKDSRDSYDSAEQILKNVAVDNLIDGEILLFHDDYTVTSELLETILKNYSKESISCHLF